MTPMDESEGEFAKEQQASIPCRKCKSIYVMVKSWDSSCGGYTDYKYRCLDCEHTWWIDGADA